MTDAEQRVWKVVEIVTHDRHRGCSLCAEERVVHVSKNVWQITVIAIIGGMCIGVFLGYTWAAG